MDVSPCIKHDAASKSKLDNNLNISMNQLSQSLTQAYQAQSKSPYFDLLPAEVRNKIYEHLLISPHTITRERQAVGPLKHNSRYAIRCQRPLEIDAAILRTCRAIAHEGYPVLYGHNIFSFTSPTQMRYFKLEGLETERDDTTEKTRSFGLNPVAGLDGRFSLMRHVKLDMARGVYHFEFGRTHLTGCWKQVFERNTLPKPVLPLRSLPLLECFPCLECLCLDFSGLRLSTDRFLEMCPFVEPMKISVHNEDGREGTILREIVFEGLASARARGGEPNGALSPLL